MVLRASGAESEKKRNGTGGSRKSGPNETDREVGNRVRVMRLSLQMSQTELAACLGVTFQQVQKYEKGTNRIGASRLQEIAKALGIPVSSLFADPHSAKSDENNIFRYIETASALRLLKAYQALPNSKIKTSLLELAEAMAEQAKA